MNETKAMPGISKEDLEKLTAQFPDESVGVKVQSLSKDKLKAMLVLYLQHTDVYGRLEQVDPNWTCEVLNERIEGKTVFTRMRMVVKGVSRENVGEGGDLKSAYSDALKRCAMLFGVGRYLYDSENVWVAYDENRDRYRTWTMKDFNARKSGGAPQPSASASAVKVAPVGTQAQSKFDQMHRDELNKWLMSHYQPYLQRFPNTQFAAVLGQRYGVQETRLMTVEQLRDLGKFMETQLSTVA